MIFLGAWILEGETGILCIQNMKKIGYLLPAILKNKFFLRNFKEGMKVQFLDDKWIHIGSISYNNNFPRKFAFFNDLAKQLDRDPDWSKLLRQN